MRSVTMLTLTWSGFDAAVDLIAAQCNHRDRSGIYGASPAGLMLAVALSGRLGRPLLRLPTPGMLLLEGVATPCLQLPAVEEVEAWCWVDATTDQGWNSVVKAAGECGRIIFPWQEAATCHPVPFVGGFHD